MGTEHFALAVQKRVRMGDLSRIGCIENDFFAGRSKILNRKKAQPGPFISKKVSILQETCKVQEKSTIMYERKEYARLEVVKCSLCNKKFLKDLEVHHWIYTHLNVNIDSFEESQSSQFSAAHIAANSSTGGCIDVTFIRTTASKTSKEEEKHLENKTQEAQFDIAPIAPQVNPILVSNESDNAYDKTPLKAPLSEEESRLVWQALYDDGPPENIIATVGTDSVTRRSFRRLRPGIWLDDELINCYFSLIAQREALRCLNSVKLPSFFFKSFFFSRLLENGTGYNYNNVKTWSRGSDIFAFNKVYVPVNINNMHWTLVVASMQQEEIEYKDSDNGDGNHGDGKACLEAFLRYLEDEHMDKKKIPLPNKESWKLILRKNDCPKQENGWDCGVFCCAFADFISRDLKLNFGQNYVTDYREKIALSIIKGCII